MRFNGSDFYAPDALLKPFWDFVREHMTGYCRDASLHTVTAERPTGQNAFGYRLKPECCGWNTL
ncbi:MAG: hypothetical protein GY807_13005 [Gammaproteobacteria bacterium]|nr:hypothetical protein [Gammaproteobacteria bacterium]